MHGFHESIAACHPLNLDVVKDFHIRSVMRMLLVHATVAVSFCYYIRRVKLVNLMERLALPHMVCWKEQ